MKKRMLILLTIMIMLCASIGAALFYFSTETDDIEQQEMVGELIAEKYLLSVSQTLDEGNLTTEGDPEDEDSFSDLEYDDNEIFSYFDESYAWGNIDCVLEIPAIDLRQSIFTGTVEQIEHDLGRWLSVTARADYVLGDTHYCIYMHNPKNKSIRISYAQYDLHEKDYMIVTQGQVVYLYEVTGVFPEWRNKCSDNYVNNMATPRDKLYIFTCGRDDWQGRNVVVEGTVHAIYQLSDWMENMDKHIENYKKAVGTIQQENVEAISSLHMSVEAQDASLLITLTGPNYTSIKNCSIGVCNADGYLIDGDNRVTEYNGSPITMSGLTEGEYYIGVYENETEYGDPMPVKVIVDKQTYTKKIVAVDDDVQQNEQKENLIKSIALFMLTTAVVFGFCNIFIVIKKNNDDKI